MKVAIHIIEMLAGAFVIYCFAFRHCEQWNEGKESFSDGLVNLSGLIAGGALVVTGMIS